MKQIHSLIIAFGFATIVATLGPGPGSTTRCPTTARRGKA